MPGFNFYHPELWKPENGIRGSSHNRQRVLLNRQRDNGSCGNRTHGRPLRLFKGNRTPYDTSRPTESNRLPTFTPVWAPVVTPELPVTRLPDATPEHFRATQSGNEAGVSTLYVPYVSPALSYVPYVSPTVQLLLLSLPRQGAATSLVAACVYVSFI
jgi:hypothetical protein